MKLQGDVLKLNRVERRDLDAPSKQIALHLLHELWCTAVDDAEWVVAMADNLDHLEKKGLAKDIVTDGVFSTIAVEGQSAEDRLDRLRVMPEMMKSIDLDLLPIVGLSLSTPFESES